MQGIIFIRITTVEKKNPNNILEYSVLIITVKLKTIDRKIEN
jgi:hypothetical protein